ncbi:MAG: hypothetical protein ACRDPY_00805 [Streptosporangiaceae bacterium]
MEPQRPWDIGNPEKPARGKSKAGRRRKRLNQAVATVIAAAITGGVSLAIAFSDGNSQTQSPTDGNSQGQSPTVGTTQLPSSGSAEQSGAPNRSTDKLYTEVTDNHLGTDVFKDPMGDAVTSAPISIPYGTQVLVKCWAPNESGMGSINVFYLIETRPWAGEYAPANTFLNADTTGALDPDVHECPAT